MTVASIDIGTNTILLLIAEVSPETKKIKVIEDLHQIPRIGKGLKPGNPFPEENVKRMIDVFGKYDNVIKKYKCDKILLSATNAFRIASNKEEVVSLINTKFNYDVNIISGTDEANLSYLGAVNNNIGDNNLVIDIGGGSTEIIYGKGNNILFSKSFSAGVVSGVENYLLSDPPISEQIKTFRNHLQNIFAEAKSKIKEIDNVIAIAGTPTTLAAVKHKLITYDESLIEGTTLSIDDLNNFVDELSSLSSEEILKRYSQIVKGREDVLLAGTIILNEIMNLLNIEDVKVSTKGIRYGAILNWLNSL